MKRAKVSLTLLVLQIILFRFFASRPIWVETLFVPYIFRPLTKVFRLATAPLPFSLGLMLSYALSVILVIGLIRGVFYCFTSKVDFKLFFFKIAAWASPFYFFYMISWGLMYHRLPVSATLGYNTSAPIATFELEELCTELVERTNATRRQLSNIQIDTISPAYTFKQAPKVLNRLGSEIPMLKYTAPSIKLATGSKLISYFGAGGIYTFWSGEANINAIHAPQDLSNVTLHEMAHQIGIASEDEANYVAWLAGSRYPDLSIQYSAYYNVVGRALSQLRTVDSTKANNLYSKLDAAVYRDAKIEAEKWKPYRNLVQEYVISPIYSIFLKANGEEYGIRSYDKVIDLLIYERRKKIQSESNVISSGSSENP